MRLPKAVPIRLRLVMWCVSLFCILLLAMALTVYNFGSLAQYRDIDRMLAGTSEHFGDSIVRELGGLPPSSLPPEALDDSGLRLMGVNLAVYDESGRIVLGQTLPNVEPPVREPAEEGVVSNIFSTVRTPAGRVRVYTVSLRVDGALAGYVQATVSLADLDRSIARVRLVLMGTMGGSTLVAAVGGLMIAARVLRPIADVTETARTIAQSQEFGRRLDANERRDELGELVRTFNEMLDSLDEAHQAQRRFVSDAAHELRTPLTSILGNLELLERARDLPAGEQAAILADVRSVAERLGGVVNELLTLARADAGQAMVLATVEFDSILIDVVRKLRPQRGSVDLDIGALEQVVVQGDEDRLRQVAENLIENSLLYTPAGGKVRVSLRRQDDAAVLTVEDTGIGIAPDDLPRIFDRFYRTNSGRSRVGGGTGLGLAIAKLITEAHDGQIKVESQPGKGSIFSVILPLGLDDRPQAVVTKRSKIMTVPPA